MRGSESDYSSDPLEESVTELLREWGVCVIDLGWSMEEANAALSYVRKVFYGGGSIGNALLEVTKRRDRGNLLPKRLETTEKGPQ